MEIYPHAYSEMLFDNLFWGLVFFVVACHIVDFYTGRAGNRRIQKWMFGVWLFLEKTKVNQIGYVESYILIRNMNRFFGEKIFSVRRAISTMIFYVGILAFCYVTIEFLRLFFGLPFRRPFSIYHFSTGFPSHYLSVYISVIITQHILSYGIKWFGQMKVAGTLFFVGFILISTITTYCFNFVIVAPVEGIIVGTISSLFSVLFMTDRFFQIVLDNLAEDHSNITNKWQLFYFMIVNNSEHLFAIFLHNTREVPVLILNDPSDLYRHIQKYTMSRINDYLNFVFAAQLSESEERDFITAIPGFHVTMGVKESAPVYSVFVFNFLMIYRLSFAVVLFLLWLCSKIIIPVLNLTLQRAELLDNILTKLAAVFAFSIKLLQLYVK